MTAENRVLALHDAMETALRALGTPGTAVPPLGDLYADIAAGATVFYRWLEGPVILFLTVSPTTFDQAAPDGPGQPTIRKGNTVQLTDRQGVDLALAEFDSENQQVTGDNVTYSVDDPSVITVTASADGSSVRCAATLFTDQVNGKLGTATVTATDNTVTPPLTGTFAFSVVASGATSMTLTPGTPFDLASPPA